MVSDFVGCKSEGKVGTETSGLVFLTFHVFCIDRDIGCGTRFLLPVQKMEKRRVVSIKELGIIYFYAIHDGRLSSEKEIDSLSK